MKQRFLSACLAFVLTLSLLPGTALAVDVNSSAAFFKQQTNTTCTLASAAMMIRRRAILDQDAGWSAITESAVRQYAWINGSGLKFNFQYNGCHVTTVGLSSSGISSLAQKKNYFISLLSSHPEGIVVYNHSRPHAVLLTDYDSYTGTFYCADPSSGAPAGRIPFSSNTIPGSGQDNKLNNINQIWYINYGSSSGAGTGQPSTPPQYSSCDVRISCFEGQVVNLYNNPGDSSRVTYFSKGQTARSSCKAVLSDGSTWYKVTASHNGADRDFWLKYESGKMTVTDLYVSSSLTLSPSSLSMSPRETRTVSINFTGSSVHGLTYRMDTYDHCSAEWGNTDFLAGRSSLTVTAISAGSTVITVSLKDSGGNILCSQNLYVTVGAGTVTVTFDPNGGSASLGSKILPAGSRLTGLPAASRSGYAFRGWSLVKTAPDASGAAIIGEGALTVDRDVTLYAVWSRNPVYYTVTFNANGGTVSTASRKYQANTALGTLPTPARTGYKFSGWYTAKTGGTKVLATKKVTANTTLYAHWTKNPAVTKYTITLNANGGTVSKKSVSVAKNAAYLSLLPTPTRSGYTFAGWYTAKTGGTRITSATKAAASRTVYARWTRLEEAPNCQVSFNANGGTVFLRTKTVLRGGRYQDLPAPVRSGYHFAGWYTAKTGGTKVTAATRVTRTGSHTLYARWSKSAVSVRETVSGNWKIYIPAYCRLYLYSSQTASARSALAAASSSEYGVACTRAAILSNGTLRYYGRINGTYYWFQYTPEMYVE